MNFMILVWVASWGLGELGMSMPEVSGVFFENHLFSSGGWPNLGGVEMHIYNVAQRWMARAEPCGDFHIGKSNALVGSRISRPKSDDILGLRSLLKKVRQKLKARKNDR